MLNINLLTFMANQFADKIIKENKKFASTEEAEKYIELEFLNSGFYTDEIKMVYGGFTPHKITDIQITYNGKYLVKSKFIAKLSKLLEKIAEDNEGEEWKK